MAKLAAFLGLACLVGIALALPTDEGVIRSSLLRAFKTQDEVDIVVSLKAGVSKAHALVEGKHFATRGAKITSLRSALVANAQESQKAIRQVLDSRSLSYKGFWITNRIAIKSARWELVRELANNADVEEIREMKVIPLEEVTPVKVDPSQETIQWGVSLVNADKLWEMDNRGEGIIVSTIDTGVRGTHSILKDNFLGEFGWYEPTGKSASPNDGNGHGSHTMGTIAGQNGYGVAPGAKWMACMGCAGSGCSESDLLDCAQFILCPHDTQGLNPDCTKAPHLVSNSWGSTAGGDTWYDDAIHAWHAANIIPIFSAGNSGPSCRTVGSPGDRNVIGVAATDINDALAYFSSVGPSVDNQQKPEISAPGLDVTSSWNDGDNAYSTISGTSMACPHVSGVVALLLQANPGMQYRQVREILFNGAEKSGLSGANQACGGVDESIFPNYAFGHGRLDALASLQNSTRFHF